MANERNSAVSKVRKPLGATVGLFVAIVTGGVAAQNAPEAQNAPDRRSVAAPPAEANADTEPRDHIDERLRICRGC
jgi:hypothetical protein